MLSRCSRFCGSDIESTITEEPKEMSRKLNVLPLHTGDLCSQASKSLAMQCDSPTGMHSSSPEERKSGRYTSSDTIVAPLNSLLIDLKPTGGSTDSTLVENEAQEHQGISIRPISEEITDLVAVTSYEYERYDRNVKTQKYFWDEYVMEPFEREFSLIEASNNWRHFVHPDGGLYFQNDTQFVPVLTDIYVYDEPSRIRLEDYIKQIYSYINKYEIKLPTSGICLVLEFRQSGRCGYYFINHAKRCLFWLEPFDILAFLGEVRVKYTRSLVGQALKSLYWLHNENFPHVRPFPLEPCTELKDILVHAVGDSLTSISSTTPYNLDTLRNMLALVNDIQTTKSHGTGSSMIIYRFLYNFYHERLLNLYGEHAARLDVNQSIHPDVKKTRFIRTLSPSLLFAPEVYLRKLQEISTDSLVRKHDWEVLLGELVGEWKDFTLYATVLLNANVAFLAIQSVDSSAPPNSRSIPQRASYFSIITSIGSIVLGLMLARQHKTTIHSSFLAFRSASALGLETLALMYSLPYALLMWGMVSFLVAFSSMCFDSRDTFTLLMVSITSVILLFFLIWCISISFEDKPYWNPWILRKVGFVQPKGILAGCGTLEGASSQKNKL